MTPAVEAPSLINAHFFEVLFIDVTLFNWLRQIGYNVVVYD